MNENNQTVISSFYVYNIKSGCLIVLCMIVLCVMLATDIQECLIRIQFCNYG